MIWIDKTLKHFFSPANPFDDVMAMRGEVFRALENRRTQRIQLGKKPYFLKQHYGVGWKEIFKNLLQLRWPIISAKNELTAILRLHTLNIPTLTVKGYGWRGWNPAMRQSFLLTEALPEHISLEDFIQQPYTLQQKRQLITEVAHIARTLHQNGVNHRDFYLCHLLLTYNEPRIYVIDLHRAGVRRKTPQRWIIKDLSGLYFSSMDAKLTQRDRLRFIKMYTQQPLKEIDNIFWKKVKIRGDELYQKHAK